ncbi:MAG: hypothetical protein PVF51_05515 [Nitrospirota bacterium]|jgi:hypothetical protein
MLNLWKRLALLLALLPILSACTPHYLIRSEYVVTQQVNESPEIIETASYKEVLPTVSTIAVRAPDSCANETTAIHSGEAVGRGLLLKTDCGVEMSELERALAKAGYQVISWDIIKNRVRHDQHMTPVKAAQELGAQVLFQVNSLERSASNVRQDARWERRFYRSSSDGDQGSPAPVNAKLKDTFESFIIPQEQGALPERRLSATINATAVLVDTGQAIWFYEWTHKEALSDRYETDVLLACKHDVCWRPSAETKPEREVYSGSTEAVSASERDASAINATYNELIGQALDDLVTRFARSGSQPRVEGN